MRFRTHQFANPHRQDKTGFKGKARTKNDKTTNATAKRPTFIQIDNEVTGMQIRTNKNTRLIETDHMLAGTIRSCSQMPPMSILPAMVRLVSE